MHAHQYVSLLFQGQVAFVVGGYGDDPPPHNHVEVFSPDGGCQHIVAPLPIQQLINPVLVLLDGHIVACGEYYDTQVTSSNYFFSKRIEKKVHHLKRFLAQPFPAYCSVNQHQ